jgi:hypothetical protein
MHGLRVTEADISFSRIVDIEIQRDTPLSEC